jgi:HSP20 family protein
VVRLWKTVFLDIHRQIDEMFEELIYRPWPRVGPKVWQPPLDILETPEAYLVVIDIPGVVPEDVHVLAGERTLTISGERPPSLSEEVVCRRSERQGGSFQRTVDFLQAVNPDKVQAEYRHGVYRIRVPKKGKLQLRHPILPR